MERSLGGVILGWGCGFIIALAWGANRAHNPQLAADLLALGIVGLGVLAAFLVSLSLSDRAARPRDEREEDAALAWPADASRTDRAGNAPALADVTAARIALLEARLAVEQAELEAAIATVAAADAASVAAEPLLRAEVLETVVGLMGSAQLRQPDDIARELEHLLEDAS
jgi:hypothetical protein